MHIALVTNCYVVILSCTANDTKLNPFHP